MKLNQKLISHYFLSARSLYSASFHFHFSSSVSMLEPSRHSQIPSFGNSEPDNYFLNRNKVFPSIPNTPNTICVYNVQFENYDDQEHNHSHSPMSMLCTHTAFLLTPSVFTRRQLARKEVHCGAAQFQEPIHQEDICDFGVWGLKWNKSNVCPLAS